MGQEDVETPLVKEPPPTQSLDNEICVLDGTSIREMRDVLGLCTPGIIVPAKRLRKAFSEIIRKSILDICDRDVLTSEVTRSNNLLIVLAGNFLDKGVQN